MTDTENEQRDAQDPPHLAKTGSVWGCVSLMLLAIVAIGVLVWFIRPVSSSGRGQGGWGGGPGGPGAGAPGASNASGGSGRPGGSGATGAPPAASSSDGGGGGGGKSGRFRMNGPMPVVAVPARLGDTDISLNALGTVTSLATVTIKAQIPGQLIEIAFTEGQVVKKGDVLAQIDPRPYELQLEQEQGQLQHDQALVKEAELDLTRYQTLVAQDSIAKQQLDAQESLVQQYRGTVLSDQAQINTAKLNLTYCRIVSPVNGRVGIRQVDVGNYVQLGDANGIVVITQLQPISVIFTVPEDHLPQVLKRMRSGAKLKTTAMNRTLTTVLGEGVLVTVDNQIDTTTGTVKMRAEFANADEALYPNQFVNIQLLVDVLHATPVVPVSAIQRGAPGTYVYVVNEDKTASVRPITIGPGTAEMQSVLSGLADGDLVVIDGADKLKEGAQVMVSSPETRNAAVNAPTTPADGSADGEPKKHHRHRPTGDPAAPGDGKDATPGAPNAPGTPEAGAGDHAPGTKGHGGAGAKDHAAPGAQAPEPGATPRKDEKAQ